MTYINTVKEMLDQAENDWPKMLARLQRVRATLLSKKQFLVNLTGDKVGGAGKLVWCLVCVDVWCCVELAVCGVVHHLDILQTGGMHDVLFSLFRAP